MPMDIEVFVANCPLCETTLKMVNEVKGPKCSLREYDLSKKDGVALEKAKKYGILAVPTIVGNGMKIFEGVPNKKELIVCSLKHGCKGRLLQ